MSFEYFQSHQLIDLIPVIESRNSTNDSGFLVSIGPRTDAALDYFELNDSFIPRLRDMAQTVRSSRWEATLRSGNFGFSFEQATTIARSLLMDIQADIQANSIAVSSSSHPVESHALMRTILAPFSFLEQAWLFCNVSLPGFSYARLLLIMNFESLLGVIHRSWDPLLLYCFNIQVFTYCAIVPPMRKGTQSANHGTPRFLLVLHIRSLRLVTACNCVDLAW